MADIIELIQQDHDEIRGLFEEFESIAPDRRGAMFRHIVAQLARHEAAEEVIVHPALRHDAGDEAAADALVAQESDAEELMATLEDLDPLEQDFLVRFRELRDDVLAHAEHEEQIEHPQLREAIEPGRLLEMGGWFEKVKASAPTHPHPSAPDAPAVQATLGPVVGLFDRVRDAARDALSK